jgi:hypothetical protein
LDLGAVDLEHRSIGFGWCSGATSPVKFQGYFHSLFVPKVDDGCWLMRILLDVCSILDLGALAPIGEASNQLRLQ